MILETEERRPSTCNASTLSSGVRERRERRESERSFRFHFSIVNSFGQSLQSALRHEFFGIVCVAVHEGSPSPDSAPCIALDLLVRQTFHAVSMTCSGPCRLTAPSPTTFTFPFCPALNPAVQARPPSTGPLGWAGPWAALTEGTC